MADDLIGLAVAAAADIVIDQSAKRRRWARALRVPGGTLFVVLIGALIFVTVRYS